MSAWTKGPWYWEGDELLAAHGRWHDNALLLVCSEMPCGENAHLIASAPDLASELEATRDWILSLELPGPDAVAGIQRVNAIDAALAKAKGE